MIARLPIVHVTTLNCYVRRTTPDFTLPDMWLSNSHVDPVDYAIWSVMQQRAYEIRVYDIDE